MIPTHDVLIIGAGISGVCAARVCTDAGLHAALIEKSRGLGGRMSTRRVSKGDSTLLFDHGAQYFTARDSRFSSLVQNWQRQDWVRIWGESPDGSARYIGTEGMNFPVKKHGGGIPCYTSERITDLKALPEGGWRLTAESGESFSARFVIITSPVPQTLDLLRQSRIETDPAFLESLQTVAYDACVAALISGADLPFLQDSAKRFNEGPLAWVANNQAKGLPSAQPTFTLHMSPEFSNPLAEHTKEDLLPLVRDTLKEHLPEFRGSMHVHKWKFSRVRTILSGPYCLVPGNDRLVLAGDSFTDSRVEDAALSGLEAADYVVDRSKNEGHSQL